MEIIKVRKPKNENGKRLTISVKYNSILLENEHKFVNNRILKFSKLKDWIRLYDYTIEGEA